MRQGTVSDEVLERIIYIPAPAGIRSHYTAPNGSARLSAKSALRLRAAAK
jgi:hypothetical protein